MRIKDGFVLRTVCGEHVVVGEGLDTVNFSKLVSLNDTAAWLWEKASEMGDFTEELLADALCQEYDVARERAEADIHRNINKWKEIGLIE